jgi:SAM-dependent methyltransferase
MEDDTLSFYEERGKEWAAARSGDHDALHAQRFASEAPKGRLLDLGCGPGWHLEHLSSFGHKVCGLEGAETLVRLLGKNNIYLGDMRSMPFSDCSFTGVWANMSYLHLRTNELAAAFSELARVVSVNGLVEMSFYRGEWDGKGFWKDEFGERHYTCLTLESLCEYLPDKLQVVRDIGDDSVLRVRLLRV